MHDLSSGYERRIGRYGDSLAREFLEVSGVRRGMRVLDVGAGTGALTERVAALAGAEAVTAIDPDEDALILCSTRVPGAATVVGRAEQLPFGDGEFDAVLAQLVIGLMDDPPRGVTEMRRVARPGGIVAACVWDFGDGMTVLRAFWDVATAVTPAAREHDQAATRPYSTRAELEGLLAGVGVRAVTSGAVEASASYDSFEDLWEPMLIPDGGPGKFLATLPDQGRREVRSRLAQQLGSPQGPFRLSARAWYAAGTA